MESDELAVARWYEPDGSRFGESFDEIVAQHEAKAWGYVRLWESAMVERGMGEEYGAALMRELTIKDSETVDDCVRRSLVAARTAPLDAVVRALAAVARRHQAEEGK